MTLGFVLHSLFDTALVALVIYMFIKEDKLIAFEEKLEARIRARIRERRSRNGK